MKDIILFGMQGAGKGTQAQKILQHYSNQYTYFSTGDFFRAISNGGDNAIGNYVKDKINQGELMPDEVTINVFTLYFTTVKSDNKAMLLDGYPRSIQQLEHLFAFIKEQKRELIGIYLHLDEETAIKRMLERGRNDDTPATIKKRIAQYYEHTQPIIDYFSKFAQMYTIDASPDVETVHNEIKKII